MTWYIWANYEFIWPLSSIFGRMHSAVGEMCSAFDQMRANLAIFCKFGQKCSAVELTQWLCTRKYLGTEPTYFSYVPKKYGLVAAQPIVHLEC